MDGKEYFNFDGFFRLQKYKSFDETKVNTAKDKANTAT